MEHAAGGKAVEARSLGGEGGAERAFSPVQAAWCTEGPSRTAAVLRAEFGTSETKDAPLGDPRKPAQLQPLRTHMCTSCLAPKLAGETLSSLQGPRIAAWALQSALR